MLKQNWIIILIVGGLLLLIFSEIIESANAPAQKIPELKQDAWVAPSLFLDRSLEGKERELVIYGEELIANTSKYLGPNGSVAAVTNGMNCQNCHLNAGRKSWGNNYGAVAANGKRYLDFLSGIAVTSLGHSHPVVADAIAQQARTLLHVSNFFANPVATSAAVAVDRLLGGGGQVFFCNSGAEANEAAIKLARKFGGRGRHVVVSALGSFHGRTLAALAATGYSLIETHMLKQSSSQWQAVLDQAGIPCAPVQNTEQLLEHPQMAAMGLLQKIPDASYQTIGLPLRLNGERPRSRSAAPALGEANAHWQSITESIRAARHQDLDRSNRADHSDDRATSSNH